MDYYIDINYMDPHYELQKISKIIDNLYLSGIYPLDNDNFDVSGLGIKCILSCVDKKHVSHVHDKLMLYHPDITVLYLPYDDNIYQNLWRKNQNVPMIEKGFEFIDKAISSGKPVLVHCMAGISRSVSLIMFYLMKKYHLDSAVAFKFIQGKRSIVHPNPSFRMQLKGYQMNKRYFSDYDADKIINFVQKKIKV